MEMYTCYYDASNTQSKTAKPLVVVGLLSSARKWSRCEREWDEALKTFDVPYLHMKEFAHSLGPFAKWKKNEPQRGAFLGQLIHLLKRNVNIAFQYRLVPEVSLKLDREYQLTEGWGSPYALTAGVTVRMAQEWFESHYPSDRVEHVVEKGDAGQNKLFVFFDGLPYAPVLRVKIDPTTQRHFMPFQAVDLFAYEARLNIERHLAGQKQVIRRSLAELRKIPHRAHLCDEEVMRQVIADNPDDCPPRV